MKILVLGGTVFVGRSIVQTSLNAGHSVSIFHRGKSNPNLFKDVENIIGDRDGNLSGLKGRIWDAVIDVSGYVPRLVKMSADLLSGNTGQYVFISSVSVYADLTKRNDESSALAEIKDVKTEIVNKQSYGALKALCEKEVKNIFPDNSLIIRPGLIVGPFDHTDRFTYWPHRVSKGGNIICPVSPNGPMQFIDARDLSEWIISLIERKNSSVFNAVGPKLKLTFGNFLDECKNVTGNSPEFIWASHEYLKENQVVEYVELPFWGSVNNGLFDTDIRKAVTEGIKFRPLSVTISDTLKWNLSLPADRKWHAGLSPEREILLLNKWNKS